MSSITTMYGALMSSDEEDVPLVPKIRKKKRTRRGKKKKNKKSTDVKLPPSMAKSENVKMSVRSDNKLRVVFEEFTDVHKSVPEGKENVVCVKEIAAFDDVTHDFSDENKGATSPKKSISPCVSNEKDDTKKEDEIGKEEKGNDGNSNVQGSTSTPSHEEIPLCLSEKLEKVAQMDDITDVLDALKQYVPSSEENIDAFFQSEAICLLIENVLRKPRTDDDETMLHNLIVTCLEHDQDGVETTGGAPCNVVARLISSTVRTISNVVHDDGGEEDTGELNLSTKMQLNEIAKWIAGSFVSQRHILRSSNDVSGSPTLVVDGKTTMAVTKKAHLEGGATEKKLLRLVEVAKNACSTRRESIRTRFQLRDSQHDLVEYYRSGVSDLVSTVKNLEKESAESSEKADGTKDRVSTCTSQLCTTRVYEDVTKPADGREREAQQQLRIAAERIDSLRSGRELRLQPLVSKIGGYEQDIVDLRLHRDKLTKEILEIDALLERRQKQVSEVEKSKAELVALFDVDLEAAVASRQDAEKCVRDSAKRERLKQILTTFGSEYDALICKLVAQRRRDAREKATDKLLNSPDAVQRRSVFLRVAKDYLVADDACRTFLTSRVEGCETQIANLRKEMTQITNSGMRSLVPSIFDELEKKIVSLESNVSEDNTALGVLKADSAQVVDDLVALSRISSLTTEDYRSLRELCNLAQRVCPNAVFFAKPTNMTPTPPAFDSAMPSSLTSSENRPPPSLKRSPSKLKTAPSLKLSWAEKKDGSSAEKSAVTRRTLLEVMEEEERSAALATAPKEQNEGEAEATVVTENDDEKNWPSLASDDTE